MSAHTPGPWQAGKTEKFAADEVRGGDKRIAQCSARNESTPETEANARIIVASLDLLAVAKEARRFIRRYENSNDNWAFQLGEMLDKAITTAEE